MLTKEKQLQQIEKLDKEWVPQLILEAMLQYRQFSHVLEIAFPYGHVADSVDEIFTEEYIRDSYFEKQLIKYIGLDKKDEILWQIVSEYYTDKIKPTTKDMVKLKKALIQHVHDAY